MSIDPTIDKRVREFCAKWNARVSRFPALRLDGSWPSIGILDAMLSPYRGQQTFQPEVLETIKDCSGYIAILCKQCWQAFGVESRIEYNPKGIVLRGISGCGLSEGAPQIVEIENAVRSILSREKNPAPIFDAFERELADTTNSLSPAVSGILFGLSPFGDGPWSTETADTFKPQIEKAVNFLARRTITFFERLYPKEMTAQVGELYLHGALYPPLGMAEKLPAVERSREFVAAAKELGLSIKSLGNVGSVFAQCPDDLLSHLGHVLVGAVLDNKAPKELFAALDGHGTFPGVLRTAMVQTRIALGLGEDWLEKDKLAPSDGSRIDFEKQIGFLPWLFVQGPEILDWHENLLIKDLVRALSQFQYDRACNLADDIIADEPKRIPIRLQRMYLHLLGGNRDEARSGLKSLLTEPDCENEFRIFSLLSMLDLADGKMKDAVRNIEKAHALTPIHHARYSQVCNDCGWMLSMSGDPERASIVLDEAIRRGTNPLTSLLNKITAQLDLGDKDGATKSLEQCLVLAPYDRRVQTHLAMSGLI